MPCVYPQLTKNFDKGRPRSVPGRFFFSLTVALCPCPHHDGTYNQDVAIARRASITLDIRANQHDVDTHYADAP